MVTKIPAQFQGEKAFIEWSPFDSYDLNAHMSFDEWGVIAHDSQKREEHTVMPPLRIPVASVSILRDKRKGGG